MRVSNRARGEERSSGSEYRVVAETYSDLENTERATFRPREVLCPCDTSTEVSQRREPSPSGFTRTAELCIISKFGVNKPG